MWLNLIVNGCFGPFLKILVYPFLYSIFSQKYGVNLHVHLVPWVVEYNMFFCTLYFIYKDIP